jgi:hypothetical protein
MHVHFLTDEPNKIAKMRALLEPLHHVDPTKRTFAPFPRRS